MEGLSVDLDQAPGVSESCDLKRGHATACLASLVSCFERAEASLSHFESAEELLRQGADPNAVGKDGRTALHMMLKKGSEPEQLAMLIAYGARLDIPDAEGKTAADIPGRKRDPAYRALVT